MFRGANPVNLDSKGRFAMPVRYREQLHALSEGNMVCTIDIHQPCLLLYPLPEWERIERKLANLSSMNPAERRIQRLLLGHATEGQLDAAGRLLLTAPLRTHATLTKHIMLVGQYNKFELWDEQTWYDQVKQDIEAEQHAQGVLSERLQDLSL
ncbi:MULTISPECIES: division/cell wall cluster transcriptional repressor MraZ [Erwiniaceae]|uniref:division/cell wall cluster transcriptional repressor MraZ n=1 Tax=Erwiniaceae TaxID=1903409 RepID=UPI0006645CF7|nr:MULTISPECIES: division/cell wall cluster transcriptional repressor MraZ [Erwiniaceae]KMV73969.1 cell division protein MraZ [bacteria symbiont BFo2 of Frankliniella occidentalis]KYP94697.1 cell division protein MraZ [bacteria symbiont BFo2 of Frankliniella occidentalis]KYP96555.1 cell division protein MraZ [bacteria symbiont BFo2 of Frankliniella occidentalis]PIJ45265.1 division/cell wall cluster transcriptional repressor MraZ [Tatumella sp. OPLPL6]